MPVSPVSQHRSHGQVALAAAGLTLRVLGAADAQAYRELRLRMLSEHPEAYGSSYEEECELALATFAARLDSSLEPPERRVFGVFQLEGRMCATAGVMFDQRPKERHRAHVVAMYVSPECRGKGVGYHLIQACLDAAVRHPLSQIVYLKVTEGNDAARALYAACGFRSYGIEPDSMRIGSISYGAELMALPLESHGADSAPV
jgi:ribosomal protein S18 acetylase RimI-like enzyme